MFPFSKAQWQIALEEEGISWSRCQDVASQVDRSFLRASSDHKVWGAWHSLNHPSWRTLSSTDLKWPAKEGSLTFIGPGLPGHFNLYYLEFFGVAWKMSPPTRPAPSVPLFAVETSPCPDQNIFLSAQIMNPNFLVQLINVSSLSETISLKSPIDVGTLPHS